MTFFAPQLQIISDLHLETPITNSQYSNISLEVIGSHLLLLGDIGLVRHDGLFVFLRRLLDENRGCHIFFIFGNHEAYQTTLEKAVETMRSFEETTKRDFGGRFHFLFRDRYDLNANVTILGCTLWSNIQPDEATECRSRLTDLNEERGIQDWTIERSRIEHRRDLGWLNTQVERIQKTEPHRNIVIATHHCPTVDPQATRPAHRSSTINSAFVSDLSKEPCWTAPAVRLWVFGHTHYSCTFRDMETGKLIVSNQRGYSGITNKNKDTRNIKIKVVTQKGEKWEVIESRQAEEETSEMGKRQESTRPPEGEDEQRNKAEMTRRLSNDKGHSVPKPSLLHRATKRIGTFLGLKF